MNILKDTKLGGPARFAKSLKQSKFPSYRFRQLTPEEINKLEINHNFCSDWSLVHVETIFTPNRVRHCTFSGHIFLPNFFGNVLGPDGVPFPTGLYHTDLHNVFIENAHVSHVGLISNQVVMQSVIIRKVGSISTLGITRFGQGQVIQLGSETGERKIPLFAENTLEEVAYSLEVLGDKIESSFFWETIEEFIKQLDCAYGFIGQDAIISNTNAIRNSWIGPSARIDGATKVLDCCILSALEQPSSVRDGAIVEHSLLQWGVKIRSNAHVRQSLLLEGSSASRAAKVLQSVIGSNTHLEQGEVSHSFLGPFVGFHHQSLLISTLWPEGMGNIGHGACVGSNHTGRKPNQELRPGKGMFFGLGSLVSFPGNYIDSPWSLVATGVHLPSQKVDFPLSLFTKQGDSVAIIPGWVAEHNGFTLTRNEAKFKQRNQARRHFIDPRVFTEELAEKCLIALERLEGVAKIKERYTSNDLLGLGKCQMSEVARQKGVASYHLVLERCLYVILIENAEKTKDKLTGESGTRKVLPSEILRELAKKYSMPDHLLLAIKRFRSIEKNWYNQSQRALQNEKLKGLSIHPDYLIANPVETPQTDFLLSEYEKAKVRVRDLLSFFKNS